MGGRGVRHAAAFAVSVALLAAGSGPAPAGRSDESRAVQQRALGTAVRKPRVRYVLAVPDATATTVVLGAAIDTGGAPTTYVVEYGSSGSYGARTPPATLTAVPQPGAAVPTTQEVRVTVGDLQPATLYHFRFVADNGAGSDASEDKTFASGGDGPSVSSVVMRASAAASAAVVAATIDTGGLPTSYRLVYGPRYASSTPTVTLPAVPRPGSWLSTRTSVRITVRDLAPGRMYPFRLLAQNAAGTSTRAGRLSGGGRRPHLSSAVVLGVPTATSALVGAVVDTGGLPTSYYVEYGARPGQRLRTPVVHLRALPGSGWSPTSKEISVTLTGLPAATTTSYRLVASNAAGSDATENDVRTGAHKPALTWIYATPGSRPGTVTFGALVDTGGLSTAYHVEYASSAADARSTLEAKLADVPRPAAYLPTVVEIRVEDVPLAAQTRYRYRIVAVNAAGRTETSERNTVLG